MRAGHFGTGPHHDRRADGDELANVGMRGDREPDALRHRPLDARRAVIRADDQFVAAAAKLVFPEDQLAVAKPDDADDEGASLLETTRLRKYRRHAQPTACADDLLRLADAARNAHRPDQRVECGADAALLLHFARGLADRLDDQGDRALVAVKVRDGERDALAFGVGHHDDELAGPCGPGHERVMDLEQERDGGKILPRHDRELRELFHAEHRRCPRAGTSPAAS